MGAKCARSCDGMLSELHRNPQGTMSWKRDGWDGLVDGFFKFCEEFLDNFNPPELS